MNIHQTDSASARRLFQQQHSTGNVYVNETGAQQYINQMQNAGLATADMINSVQVQSNNVFEEQERMVELWAVNAPIGATTQMNIIHRVSTVEELQSLTPHMMDYVFSNPEIYNAYSEGTISPWTNYTPSPNTSLWETVNTGTTTLHGKSITITEFINKYKKLSVDERLCIRDAQELILDELDDGDPWKTSITYY